MDSNDSNGKNRRPVFKNFLYGIMAVAFLLIITLGRSTPFWKQGQNVPRLTVPPQQGQQAPSQVPGQPDRLSASGSQDITTAAEKVIPSVVGLTVVKTSQGKRFQAVGTGVIVDAAGHILTNNHVAGGSVESITASLYDGRDVSGTTIWTDPVLDLAIVKISAGGLQAATLGDSKTIRIGQQAIAIGNPLGLTFQRTVTAGIISAVNRTIEVEKGTFMENLIQTDASINPGNSGGPLININGEVVGINTIKVTSAEAMGFAVPINYARSVVDRLRSDGRFLTPNVGLQTLDRELGRAYSFVVDRGIYVYDCKDGGCAHKAGIRKGDAILSVDGTSVNTPMDFKEALNRADATKGVILRVKAQDGTEEDVHVVFDGEK